eukprot:15471216-Alexandrium_andersonii.AAC.1
MFVSMFWASLREEDQFRLGVDLGFDVRCALGQKFAKVLRADTRLAESYKGCKSTLLKQEFRKNWSKQQFERVTMERTKTTQ